jgi:hypothetical protein
MSKKVLGGIVLGYTLLAAIYYLAVHKLAGTGEGTFGDSFGAFNAYFTGLAFLGVIYTVLLQTRQVEMQAEELRLQREELKETRGELKRTADAQTNQLRLMAMVAELEALNSEIALIYQNMPTRGILPLN